MTASAPGTLRMTLAYKETSSLWKDTLFRAVFWDILPCKMIVDQRFRGAYCLHHQGQRQPLKGQSTLDLTSRVVALGFQNSGVLHQKRISTTDVRGLNSEPTLLSPCHSYILSINQFIGLSSIFWLPCWYLYYSKHLWQIHHDTKLALQNYAVIISTDNTYIIFNNNKIHSLDIV
jgi:hypothetical protein